MEYERHQGCGILGPSQPKDVDIPAELCSSKRASQLQQVLPRHRYIRLRFDLLMVLRMRQFHETGQNNECREDELFQRVTSCDYLTVLVQRVDGKSGSLKQRQLQASYRKA